MEVDTGVDRKRKAETEDEHDENPTKRIWVENGTTEQPESQPVTAEEEENVTDKEAEQSTYSAQDTQTEVQKTENVDSAKVEPAPLVTLVPFDRLIFVHFEATCDENPTNPAAVQVTKENSEIIEFTFVVVKASNLEILHKQQIYVKPERTPFTHFCSEVTGLQWSTLENAGTLKDAVSTLESYIQKEIEAEKKSFCFVTHGGWPLRIQLPREARDKNLSLPSYLAYCRMFDLKQEIQLWQVHHPEVSLRSTSVRDLCETFHISRITDQSIGLNNALTTLEIMKYLLSFQHKDVFVHPIDTMADLKQFKKEESQVVHLAGLPYEVTQGELEAWFSSNGLRPTTMWMIQPSDNSKPSISGFVLFQQHDDAIKALGLNGRCLGDRSIEVCPSSSRVIDAAGNMLVPFPLQAKSRHLRPGDWNCFNCNFHNFASRLHCFKCNTENPTPTPTVGQVPPPVQPVYHGDWMCPNCHFHNYSSRMQCKKCAASKPPKQFKGNKKLVNVPPSGQHPPTLEPSRPPPQPSYYNATHTSTGSTSGPISSSTIPTGPSAGASGSSGYHSSYASGGRPHHHITFRPGDWYCPNKTCGFQNFASRSTCFRCHTANPGQSQPSSYHPPQQNQPQTHSQYSPHQPGYGYSSESTSAYNTNYSGNVGGASSNSSNSNNNNSGSNSGGGGGGGGYGYGQSGSSGGYSSQNGNIGYGGQNGNSSNNSSSYAPPGGGYTGGGSSGSSGYSYSGGHPPGSGGYSGVHQAGPPAGPGSGGPYSTQFRAGDWICPSCNSHNFASRFQCLKCSTAKPYNPLGSQPASYAPGASPVKRMFNNY